MGSLEGHESTVACLSFSPDDRFLASAGRDRTLCVFSIAAEDTGFSASAVAVVLKAHKRIVWDCRCLSAFPLFLRVRNNRAQLES